MGAVGRGGVHAPGAHRGKAVGAATGATAAASLRRPELSRSREDEAGSVTRSSQLWIQPWSSDLNEWWMRGGKASCAL
jgi:hypothetical protein